MVAKGTRRSQYTYNHECMYPKNATKMTIASWSHRNLAIFD
jgi:hypothetical protein